MSEKEGQVTPGSSEKVIIGDSRCANYSKPASSIWQLMPVRHLGAGFNNKDNENFVIQMNYGEKNPRLVHKTNQS